MVFFCLLCKRIDIIICMMRLELTNINKIKSAAIDLKGLTVIAGTNDSGKSTIGKMLFTVVKSLGETHVNKDEERMDRIQEKLEELYRYITRRYFIVNKIEEKEKFKQEFLPPRMMAEILSSFYGNSSFSGDEREQMLQSYIADKKAQMRSFNFGSLLTESCNEKLDALYEEISEKTEPELLFAREFQSGIQSEFLSRVCSVGTDGSTVAFHGEEGCIKAKIKDNKIEEVHMSPDLYFSLTDVTFIETPLYMQLMNVFSRATTYKELSKRSKGININPVVPMHIKDLANKLELSQYNFGTRTVDAMGIERIINGYFEYDRKARDFQIVRKQHGKTVKVNSINVASGIKMFGLIQLLLEVEEISANKMLIVDEPENHLHPKWQIECAHLLVKMAKAGIPLMVSSHSPYFIQGIRYFANKEQAEEWVNYYLAEEDEGTGYSIVTEVTDDLNKIFVKLAEPMNEIMNLD